MSTQKVIEEQVMSALAALVGQRGLGYMDRIDDALEAAYNASPQLQMAPFDLSNCLMIEDKVPVVSAMLFRRNDKTFKKVFEPLKDYTCLVQDPNLRGKDSLFVIRKFPEGSYGEASVYINRLMKCNPLNGTSAVIVGRDNTAAVVVAFQLKQLFEKGKND